jgi:hypothetical protein
MSENKRNIIKFELDIDNPSLLTAGQQTEFDALAARPDYQLSL